MRQLLRTAQKASLPEAIQSDGRAIFDGLAALGPGADAGHAAAFLDQFLHRRFLLDQRALVAGVVKQHWSNSERSTCQVWATVSRS